MTTRTRRKCAFGLWLAMLAGACGEVDGDRQPAPLPAAKVDQAGPGGQLINPNIELVAEQEVGTITLGQSTGRRLTIEIKRCKNSVPQQSNDILCQPSAGFLAVGGGAWAESPGSSGALLTASFPRDPSFTAWIGRSKDHGIVDAHTLHVFVIGLRAGDLLPNDLRAHMFMATAVSTVSESPTAVALLPQGYRIISGGAESLAIGGPGQLLTSSSAGCSVDADGRAIGDCRIWVASAKAHVHSHPATVKAYAVGIATLPPGLGHLDIRYRSGSVSGGGGLHVVDKVVSSEFVVSGIGAATWGNSAGRLLTRMAPATSSFVNDKMTAWSKDHLVADGGTTLGLLVEITTPPPF